MSKTLYSLWLRIKAIGVGGDVPVVIEIFAFLPEKSIDR